MNNESVREKRRTCIYREGRVQRARGPLPQCEFGERVQRGQTVGNGRRRASFFDVSPQNNSVIRLKIHATTVSRRRECVWVNEHRVAAVKHEQEDQMSFLPVLETRGVGCQVVINSSAHHNTVWYMGCTNFLQWGSRFQIWKFSLTLIELYFTTTMEQLRITSLARGSNSGNGTWTCVLEALYFHHFLYVLYLVIILC